MIAVVLLVSGAPAVRAQSDNVAASASGEAAIQPWSGWWWPAGNSGPTLFAPGGPLDKYDQYLAATSGQSPGTRAWEREELYVPGVAWAGHCNGFAAAALLEPEPTEPVNVLGLTFHEEESSCRGFPGLPENSVSTLPGMMELTRTPS